MVQGCVSEKLLDAVGLCCEVQTKRGKFLSSVFFKGKQPRLSTYADAQDKMHPPLLCHTGRAACNSTNVHNKK